CKTEKNGIKLKAAALAVLSTDPVHCDSGAYEAFFGGGTKLTVLGKKYEYLLKLWTHKMYFTEV
uniref:Uncharacterized protein n=1 Tax=Gasterosteus aculeatus TaxID=69293 RepID=G3NNU7_GASAC